MPTSDPTLLVAEFPHSAFLDPFDEIHTHWHNLPHWQQGDVYYFCTWRLGDALPASKLAEWQEEKSTWLAAHPEPWDARTEADFHNRFSRRMDKWLDAGHGTCLLRSPILARVVADAFHHFDQTRYTLDSFIVMPNHVHVLFRMHLDDKLPAILHSWKSFTAKQINRLAGRNGPLWQEDYWDRIIRNEMHLHAVRRYIADNANYAPGLLWQCDDAQATMIREVPDTFYRLASPAEHGQDTSQRGPEPHGQDASQRSTGVPPVFSEPHGQEMPVLL